MKHLCLITFGAILGIGMSGLIYSPVVEGQIQSAGPVQPQRTPTYDPTQPGSWPANLDAVVAAPKNHKVVLENERVRVLDVMVSPGENEALHMHRWPSVMYVMAEDNIRDYDADGKLLYDTKTDKAPMSAPYTVWMEPQSPHG